MSKLFFGGVPTDVDVRKLRERYPSIAPGELINHAEVEAIIGVGRHIKRYRTVTAAWRASYLKMDNFVLDAVAGVGFRRLTEIERSQKDRSKWRQDQSRAARKVRDMSRVDTREFGERDQRNHDHARRLMQAHVEFTTTTVRELAPPPRMEQLPRGPTGLGEAK